MTPEEKHIQLCSSFISQIRGIYLNIEAVDGKREFIMTTGGVVLFNSSAGFEAAADAFSFFGAMFIS